MEILNRLPPSIRDLYDEGQALKERMLSLLRVGGRGDGAAVEELFIETLRWLNTMSVEVLPLTIQKKEDLIAIIDGLRDTFSEFRSSKIDRKVAEQKVSAEMDRALVIIISVAAPVNRRTLTSPTQESSYIPDTAFILMWMSQSVPELEDVSNAIKEVCGKFGVRALRADDVEHEDKITDVILENIKNSEFLIADLSGERPNVYYEVGYAHAINKRPILFRKQGTTLHFDLSVHNVPEYKNISDLKNKLHRRLEERLGRKAEQP